MPSSEEKSPFRTIQEDSTSGYSSVINGAVESNQEGNVACKCNDEEPTEDFKFKTVPRRSKLIFVLCTLTNLLSSIGFALPAPFYPQEAEKKGVSSTMVGIIFSIFQVVILLASPILGNFLTRIGAKFMLLSGIFLGGGSSVLFGLLYMCPSGTPFIVTSLLCRSIEALGLTAFMTACFAILSNEFPKHTGTVFAILETVSGIGYMIGPAVGGVLYKVGGFGLPFYAVGSAVLLNGIIVFCILPEPVDLSTKRKVSIWSLFRSPLVLFVLYQITITSLGVSFLDPTFADHLKPFNLSTIYIGLIFVLTPALYAITAPFWGHLSDAKDIQAPVIIIGNLVMCIGYLFIGPSHWLTFLPFKLWVVIVGTSIIGLGFSCTLIPTLACFLQGAYSVGWENNMDTYGVISGIYGTAYSLGGAIGPIMGGALVDNFGFRDGVTLIAMLHLSAMIVSVICFTTLRSKRKSKAASDEDLLIVH